MLQNEPPDGAPSFFRGASNSVTVILGKLYKLIITKIEKAVFLIYIRITPIPTPDSNKLVVEFHSAAVPYPVRRSRIRIMGEQIRTFDLNFRAIFTRKVIDVLAAHGDAANDFADHVLIFFAFAFAHVGDLASFGEMSQSATGLAFGTKMP